MSSIDFRKVRAAISMREVLELIGFVAHKSDGSQVRGPCPVHGSAGPKSTSFSVNLTKNTFQCFRCHAAGNLLDLWRAVTKLSLYDAVIDLCNRLNRAVPEVVFARREPRIHGFLVACCRELGCRLLDANSWEWVTDYYLGLADGEDRHAESRIAPDCGGIT